MSKKKEKFVPYEKESKKAKREIDKKKRGDWGDVNPVSRIEPDKTKYNRKKFKRDDYYADED